MFGGCVSFYLEEDRCHSRRLLSRPAVGSLDHSDSRMPRLLPAVRNTQLVDPSGDPRWLMGDLHGGGDA